MQKSAVRSVVRRDFRNGKGVRVKALMFTFANGCYCFCGRCGHIRKFKAGSTFAANATVEFCR